MLRLRPLSPILASALLAACGDGLIEVEQGRETPGESGRYGLVVLTAQLGEPGVAISGQLLDYQGITRRDALLALAAPELAWLAELELSPGTCRLLDTDASEPRALARVDLLDAGPLVVRVPDPLDDVQAVPPRELPPLVAALAGVVYDAATPLPYLAGGTYRLDAEGAETGPVTAEIEAPGPVWLEAHTLDPDDDSLDVRIGGGPDALVLLSRVGTHPVAAACRPLEGADALRVPPEALRHLGGGLTELALIRLRRSPLHSEGLPGTVLFITRDATWLTLPDLAEERVR